MTGTQKRLQYMPNTVPAEQLSLLQLQGLPSLFFPCRPRNGFPPMPISVPTSLVLAPGPDSTSVNTSFIPVLPLNQLSGILLSGGTLTGTNRHIPATKLWLPGCEMVIWKVS